MNIPSSKSLQIAALLVAAGGMLPYPAQAQAQEKVEIEQLQAMTFEILNSLVESGVMTRDKADQIIAAAKAKAKAASVASAPAPEVGKDGKKVVRVPYVPEALKKEMRDQIKQEVIAQARNERWGAPESYPEWMSRFKFAGDFRLREELVRPSQNNSAPGLASYDNGGLTRAADFTSTSANTQQHFDRSRVRLRLGVTGEVTDNLSVVTRLSTGNTNDRTSTNQTLGQNFNKYAVVLDQAYLDFHTAEDKLRIMGGRMPNPFLSTDLVWADDLGFEGAAASLRQDIGRIGTGFVTTGYFPLSENKPNASKPRYLLGVQGGLDRKYASGRTQFGMALYDYKGVEGTKEDTAAFLGNVPNYATRYEYGSSFRQRGNTLFRVNAPGDATTNYGLASRFRVLDLTLTSDMDNVLPVPLRMTANYVRNLSFDRAEMSARAGTPISDGKGQGFLVRAQVGSYVVNKPNQWNASLTYRRLGSDAVLDAFTNSDFGLGGTNNKGVVLGVNYGVLDNTWISARWMSSNQIDSYAPDSNSPTRFSVDSFQLDLNARF